MIGYKVAKHDDIRVIVTLEIPEDAQTNMDRPSVVVRETAQHRTNKAKVLAIEDASGTPYTTANSFNYDKKSLTYTVGEMIEEPSYNPDPEEVYAEGIHYFLTRRVTELYGLGEKENGLYQCWYDNGQKFVEVTYVDGKRQGLCVRWYDNGQKEMEANYVDGKFHGLVQHWYPNGQKETEETYVDGDLHGFYQEWHSNGQKEVEATYVDGKFHGLYQSWHSNGQKNLEATYIDGELHWPYRRYSLEGTIIEDCKYERRVKV